MARPTLPPRATPPAPTPTTVSDGYQTNVALAHLPLTLTIARTESVPTIANYELAGLATQIINTPHRTNINISRNGAITLPDTPHFPAIQLAGHRC